MVFYFFYTFVQCYIQYNHPQDMKFRLDELEICVPFFIGKYKNISSFIRCFLLALNAIDNQFNLI